MGKVEKLHAYPSKKNPLIEMYVSKICYQESRKEKVPVTSSMVGLCSDKDQQLCIFAHPTQYTAQFRQSTRDLQESKRTCNIRSLTVNYCRCRRKELMRRADLVKGETY